MKTLLFFIWAWFYLPAAAQEIPATSEEQLEKLAESTDTEPEDDGWMEELKHLRNDPLNINRADAVALRELRLLTDLQIAQLIRYRHLLGPLISVYELQAVPGWDPATIRKLMPFISVAEKTSFTSDLRAGFHGGTQQILLRYSRVVEKQEAYNGNTTGTKYAGDPLRLFFRYRYHYKNRLQFGLTADKDAGEPFFRGDRKTGFDFYSFHFFSRHNGILQSLALGDYTVQLGQGLLEWQGFAIKKSSAVMQVKRQAAVLRPYTSSGEYFFHRGAAISLRKKRMEALFFLSARKLTATITGDTSTGERLVSSISHSGYHRTLSELSGKNKLGRMGAGTRVGYNSGSFHAALNAVYYRFSLPLKNPGEPYQLYEISGSHWYNLSLDQSFTYRNLHAFSEVAVDKKFNKAVVAGLLMSVDPSMDVSMVYRAIPAAYRSLLGNAFTESTEPNNETGFYLGFSFRPFPHWQLDAYIDQFRFPWLKWLLDAPGNGSEWMGQLSFIQRKKMELNMRLSHWRKPVYQSSDNVIGYPVPAGRTNWRIQIEQKLNERVTLRSRVECSWFKKESDNQETGYSVYGEISWRPARKKYLFNGRIQRFETGSYDSRIYAYEKDVLYSQAVPAFSGKGYRYYFNLQLDLFKNLAIWVRWAQTRYDDISGIGSGPEFIEGDRKSEIKLQLVYSR